LNKVNLPCDSSRPWDFSGEKSQFLLKLEAAPIVEGPKDDVILAGRHQNGRTLRIKICRINLIGMNGFRDDLGRTCLDVFVDDQVRVLSRVDDGKVGSTVNDVGESDASDVGWKVVQADDADKAQVFIVPNLF
jgi:hypothetical protein